MICVSNSGYEHFQSKGIQKKKKQLDHRPVVSDQLPKRGEKKQTNCCPNEPNYRLAVVTTFLAGKCASSLTNYHHQPTGGAFLCKQQLWASVCLCERTSLVRARRRSEVCLHAQTGPRAGMLSALAPQFHLPGGI